MLIYRKTLYDITERGGRERDRVMQVIVNSLEVLITKGEKEVKVERNEKVACDIAYILHV